MVGIPPVIVGRGAGEIGAVPTRTEELHVRQVPPRVVMASVADSVLPTAVPGGTKTGRVAVVVAPSAVAGTFQVRVVPSMVAPLGRLPSTASSMTSARSTVTTAAPAAIATLPVLRTASV